MDVLLFTPASLEHRRSATTGAEYERNNARLD